MDSAALWATAPGTAAPIAEDVDTRPDMVEVFISAVTVELLHRRRRNAIKVQSTDQFNGVWVIDCRGRRIGRVVGARPGDALFTVDWLVVRVRWRGRRAVPADSAAATMTGLQIELTKTHVLASPSVSASWPDTPVGQAAIADYYTQSSTLVTP